MTDPGIGGVVEIAAHAGGTRDVAHQDEHRDDGELIEARDREGLGAERRQGMGPAADRDGAEEAGGEDRQADRHPKDEQREQRDDARRGRSQCRSFRASRRAAFVGQERETWSRRASTKTSTISTAHRGRCRSEAPCRWARTGCSEAACFRRAAPPLVPVTNSRHDQIAVMPAAQRLDAEARDPLELRPDDGGHHVGGDVRSGAPAITDGAGHREYQQHDREVERPVRAAR